MKPFLSVSPAVLVGDLNIDGHRDICDRFGLVSAYHAFYGAEFASEKHATHYFRRKRSARYHCDYCFIPDEWRRRLRDVRVGTYRQWIGLTDHAPLIVDISMPRLK
jgi:endonuclease/exonuclease/phosphatase family metal-dependent hydrolase